MKKITFRALRMSKKLDVGFLARQFEVSEHQIRSIEEDSGDIPDEVLEEYLNFFQVNYDQLYFGREYQEAAPSEEERRKQGFPTYITYKRNHKILGGIFVALQNTLVVHNNPTNLKFSMLFVLNDIYFLLTSLFFKSRENNARFALAYLFVKIRKWRNYHFLKWLYLLLMVLPTPLSFLFFHELPNTLYGYLYSWPANLCAALIVFSLWEKIWKNYFEENQRQFFESFEKYFTPFFRLFLPVLLLAVVTFAINFPQTQHAYFLTNVLSAVPATLNNFFIGLFVIVYFLPLIDLRYRLDLSILMLFPLKSGILSVVYLFLCSFQDILYGKYANLGTFYVDAYSVLQLTGLIYLFLAYRFKLNRSATSSRGSAHVGLLLIAYVVLSVLIYGVSGNNFALSSIQTSAFIPTIFQILIFAVLFFYLRRQAGRAERQRL